MTSPYRRRGFNPKTVKVKLGAGVQQTTDLTPETGQAGATTGETPAAKVPQNLPNAPSSSQTEPSLPISDSLRSRRRQTRKNKRGSTSGRGC
jgi:hypothetical protein